MAQEFSIYYENTKTLQTDTHCKIYFDLDVGQQNHLLFVMSH